tara:strand:- start:732 stop:869 length:138 start_codon:yes stop_codon:yes gene_type:complete
LYETINGNIIKAITIIMQTAIKKLFDILILILIEGGKSPLPQKIS